MINRQDIGHMQSYSLRDKQEIKKRYTGSYKGMRFLIRPIGESKDDAVFEAYVFPEPFNFDKTAPEEKQREEFPYSEEGLDKICDWLNRKYEEEKPRWESALKAPLI